MTSNLWMFNDGSYKHRGVWHAIDALYEVKEFPAETKETQRELWQPDYMYHSNPHIGCILR